MIASSLQHHAIDRFARLCCKPLGYRLHVARHRGGRGGPQRQAEAGIRPQSLWPRTLLGDLHLLPGASLRLALHLQREAVRVLWLRRRHRPAHQLPARRPVAHVRRRPDVGRRDERTRAVLLGLLCPLARPRAARLPGAAIPGASAGDGATRNAALPRIVLPVA